jgi:hypothetical protein
MHNMHYITTVNDYVSGDVHLFKLDAAVNCALNRGGSLICQLNYSSYYPSCKRVLEMKFFSKRAANSRHITNI